MNIKRIQNNKFKTNEIALFLTVPLEKETITKNALLPSVLRRGSEKYINQTEIGKRLEEMYGAFFNCGVDKTGNYCVLKFYIEALSNKYVPEKENLSQKVLELLFEIVFNPLVIENGFKAKYVEQEKNNLKRIIKSKKDNKEVYAYSRCVETVFENDPYGIDRHGYLSDLESINSVNLYEYYKHLVKNAQIDLIINGEDSNSITINEKQFNNKKCEKIENKQSTREETKIIKEEADVTQGKLIMGLNVPSQNKYAVTLYNAVLGGGANSKLFQNVREREGLAYYSGSRYLRRKDAIFIITGIELPNYDKAVKVIKEQLKDMKDGKITEEEFEKAKKLVTASVKSIKESQEDAIAFEFDQGLFEENLSVDEYLEKLSNVTINDVLEIAKSVKLNTIYFLTKEVDK